MPQIMVELEILGDQTLVGLLAAGVRDPGLQTVLLTRGVYLVVYYRTNGIDIQSTLTLRGKRQHASLFGPNEQRVMPLSVVFGNPTVDDFSGILPGNESDVAIHKLSPEQVDRGITALLEQLQEPLKTNNIVARRLRSLRKHNEKIRTTENTDERRHMRTAAIRAVQQIVQQRADFFELLLATANDQLM